MKPVAKEVIEVTSTLDGDVIEMGIAQDSLAHIMEVLTNLYSDEELAILREISTNALDAHIEAGQTRPIEVTLPQTLKQTLIIQDWGTGLDRRDFEKIYSQYGLSTETDEQTGFLGLGCKSPLAYTHTFTVTGVKPRKDYSGDREFMGGGAGQIRNLKTVVSVSKNDEGIGQMTIVYEGMTDEPSGVTVSVPTRAHSRFFEKAEYLFQFWPAGSVLIDGAAPKHYEGLKISDRITLMRDMRNMIGYRAPNYVLMGNVPYPVDPVQFDFGLPDGYTIIGHVPNGSMHIHPSREALRYTKATLTTLQQLAEQFNSDLLDSINKEIDAAPTRHDALKVVLRWRSSLPKSMDDVKFKYRDLTLPTNIVVPGGDQGQTWTVADGQPQTDYYGKNYRVGWHQRMQAIDIQMVSDAVWVYNFDRTFTPTVKKKLWMYMEMQGRENPQTFILAGAKIDSPWIDPKNVIDWAPIEELKLPRISTSTGKNLTGRRAASYDVFVAQNGKSDWEYDVLHDEIDSDIPLYYFEGNAQSASYLAKDLAKLEDEFQVVPMAANRVGKFKRLFPQAKELNGRVFREYAAIWHESLSNRDVDFLVYNDDYVVARSVDALPECGIIDPTIKRVQALKNYNPRYSAELVEQYQFFRRRGHGFGDRKVTNPFSRYPLMQTDTYRASHISRKALKRHNLLYINAAYTALYQEK